MGKIKYLNSDNRGTHIMLVFSQGHDHFICDQWGILVKNTKIDSYQFMDLNTHQDTKMQTLALSNINHKT